MILKGQAFEYKAKLEKRRLLFRSEIGIIGITEIMENAYFIINLFLFSRYLDF